MPNLDVWIHQISIKNKEHMAIKTVNNFEHHMLSIKAERQKMIRPNCYLTYNERHQKIIELVDWTLKKYKDSFLKKTQQQNEEQIIDNIIEELKKRYSHNQKERSSTKKMKY